jgi:hypothetical protein
MTNPTPHNTSRRTALRTGLVAGAGTAVLLSVRDLAGAATATLPSRSASAALASSAGCATLTPEETQGPFWVDERLNRSDIRADSETGAVQTESCAWSATTTCSRSGPGAGSRPGSTRSGCGCPGASRPVPPASC